MATDFGNFSPQSFERLIQALCIHVLGPGTAIFGSGPDGAREATFEGEVPFPSNSDRWNGYIVVQAKCRERLRHNVEDADWLCVQIKNDLDKFLDPARRLRTPEYYLLASNVTLSPVADVGGKAKVDILLSQYAKRMGIQRYHVWAADDLRAILDTARDVRTSFAAWLTPSDVLAAIIDSLKRPNLTRLVPLALARDLRNERDVRLREAGQETDKSLFLESVFVDLPALTPFQEESDKQDETAEPLEADQRPDTSRRDEIADSDAEDTKNVNETESPHRVVSQIFRRAADKLDPTSLTASWGNVRRRPARNRIVVLGGPGQGKSTIGQFIAQVARARLLSTHESSHLNPQTHELIAPILNRARVEDVPLDGPCRFPVRVEIPAFADALNKAVGLTMLSYIAMRLSRDIDSPITVNDLREWLTICPWLVIFDGLDEVPASGNRSAVIGSIDAFWDEVHLAQADVIAIVTTRPQGYNFALSSRF